MTALFDASKLQFSFFTPNVGLTDENCFAKLFYCTNSQRYVLKSRYCLNCSKTPSYFCDRDPLSRAWPFQQELMNFRIVSASCLTFKNLENVSEKIKLPYTSAQVSLPHVDNHFNCMTWCPMMIKTRD